MYIELTQGVGLKKKIKIHKAYYLNDPILAWVKLENLFWDPHSIET